MISVLFTQTLPSLMEITSEARAFCGSCFLRDAQGGCAPGVPGGPGLSLELDSSVVELLEAMREESSFPTLQ